MVPLSAAFPWSWNTSGDGDPPQPPGSLCWCLTTISENKLFLISNQRQHVNTHGFPIAPQDSASHEEQGRSLKEKESSSFHSNVWNRATEKNSHVHFQTGSDAGMQAVTFSQGRAVFCASRNFINL